MPRWLYGRTTRPRLDYSPGCSVQSTREADKDRRSAASDALTSSDGPGRAPQGAREGNEDRRSAASSGSGHLGPDRREPVLDGGSSKGSMRNGHCGVGQPRLKDLSLCGQQELRNHKVRRIHVRRRCNEPRNAGCKERKAPLTHRGSLGTLRSNWRIMKSLAAAEDATDTIPIWPLSGSPIAWLVYGVPTLWIETALPVTQSSAVQLWLRVTPLRFSDRAKGNVAHPGRHHMATLRDCQSAFHESRHGTARPQLVERDKLAAS